MEPNSLYMRSTSFTPKPTNIRHSELSIFDAEKYFNQTTTTTTTTKTTNITRKSVSFIEERPRLSSVSADTDGYSTTSINHCRVRSFHATPTSSSEASWNSQTGLLSNPPGAIVVSLKNVSSTHNTNVDSDRYRQRKGMLPPSRDKKRFFRPKCPCSGRKSVQVCEKNLPEPTSITDNNRKITELVSSEERKSSVLSYVPSNTTVHKSIISTRGGPGVVGGDGFSFPILKIHKEDPPRDSLEVFQPSGGEQDPIKLSETVRERISLSSGSYGLGVRVVKDDDAASDASSDLFEIESFSTQTTGTTSFPMYPRRESLDEAATTYNRRLSGGDGGFYAQAAEYEPSEASVDWSVTTAEGFDRASVSNISSVSGWGGGGGGGAGENDGGGGGGGGWGKLDRKSSNYGLLNLRCAHEKAVSVGPNPVKCVVRELSYGSGDPNSNNSATKYVGGGRVTTKMTSHSSSSNSARLSLTIGAAPPRQ